MYSVQMMSDLEFSHPFDTATLGAEPQKLDLAASESDRTALVERFGLVSLSRLSASVEIRRVRGHEGVIEVRGTLDAAAEQACRVTLEPVAETVSESFQERFVPLSVLSNTDEVEIDPLSEDPEPFEGTVLDIGEVVAQSLSVALNPYPRATPEDEESGSDAVYRFGDDEDAGNDDDTPAADHPFAGLAALKQTMKNKK